MILDKLTEVALAQAFTSDAATGSSYDLGNTTVKRDIAVGQGVSLCWFVTVAADFTTGDETYEFQVIQSANADLSSPDILGQRTVLASGLTVGAIVEQIIPPGAITKRYLGGFFNGGGTTPTLTASSYLLPSSFVQQYKAYTSSIVIA